MNALLPEYRNGVPALPGGGVALLEDLLRCHRVVCSCSLTKREDWDGASSNRLFH